MASSAFRCHCHDSTVTEKITMPSRNALATLSLLALCCSAARAETVELPIIDGAVATSAQYYGTIGFLDFDGEAFCTGTLIAPTVVISAAHCFVTQDEDTDAIIARTPASDVFVVAGEVYAEQTPWDRYYDVLAITVHPGFPNPALGTDPSGIAQQDDIAVVLVAEPIEEVDIIRIPSVAEARAAMESEPTVIIAGYGLTDANAQQAGVLHIAETVLGVDGDFEFVAGAPGRPDSCKGDSGGPAYVIHQDIVHVFGASARAVASSDKLCGDGGIYTFVPAYRSWIAAVSEGNYTEPGPLPDTINNPGPGSHEDEGCRSGSTDSTPGALAIVLLLAAWGGRRGRRKEPSGHRAM